MLSIMLKISVLFGNNIRIVWPVKVFKQNLVTHISYKFKAVLWFRLIYELEI